MRELFLIALVFALCSCDSDTIIEFAPKDVSLFVENAAGDNLLDPATEGNILDQAITAEYQDTTYELVSTKTRLLPATWNGLRIEPLSHFSFGDQTLVLKFGEFGPQQSYHGEPLTIDWGDGTQSEVKFDLYVKGRKSVVCRLWIDGELVSDNSLTAKIVK